MTWQNILGVVPAIQSAALVGHNVELVKKKKKTAGDFVKHGVTNVVGTSLIHATAKLY